MEIKKPDLFEIQLAFRDKNKDNVDSVIKALNKLHNKEYLEEYRKNGDTYDLLRGIEILYPSVTKALKLEKDLFFEMIKAIDRYGLEKHFFGLHVEVGLWWWKILTFNMEKPLDLYETIERYAPSGKFKLELDHNDRSSSYYCYGEGYCQTTDNINISYNFHGSN